ncbi:TlpA family protein disulfide reductase [Pedobacter panaciterrae]|uniref:TlpA family protein disulfide reductase n=1 Tax=Pedobacter panaciterrae TaxID=363849 RepID=UPI002591661A|nr:thioredoxin family protein [uncultured Pedobacter sp.]
MKNSTYQSLILTVRHIVIIILLLCIQSRVFAITATDHKEKIHIVVSYKQTRPNDSLLFRMTDPAGFITKEQTVTIGKDGCFSFETAVIDQSGYFEILTDRTFTKRGGGSDLMVILDKQFWEAGDSVKITIDHTETGAGILSNSSFSGKSADKYTLREHIKNFTASGTLSDEIGFDGNLTGDTLGNRLSAIQVKELEMLEAYKDKLTDLAFNVIKSEICFMYNPYYNRIKSYLENAAPSLQSAEKTAFVKRFRRELMAPVKFGIPDSCLVQSQTYVDFIFGGLKAYALVGRQYQEPDTLFDLVKAIQTDAIREPLIMLCFKEKRSANIAKQLSEAESLITSSRYKSMLKTIRSQYAERLLDYTVTDPKGQVVKLSRYANKVVLLDFWYNGCGYCARYYQTVLKKVEDLFKDNKGVVFLSISIDKSRKKWLDGIESKKYTSPDAINFNTNGQGQKDPLVANNNITAAPHVILLNKAGRIAQNNSTKLYEYESLIQEINQLLQAN